jgi:hypothetical protein
MLRLFKSLLVFLTVVAFGAATISAALALPCNGHDDDLHHENVRAAPLVLPSDTTAGQMVNRLAHHHPFEGKCSHPCCSSPSVVLVSVERPIAALSAQSVAFAFPTDEFLTGIAVAPLTGPPRPSA